MALLWLRVVGGGEGGQGGGVQCCCGRLAAAAAAMHGQFGSAGVESGGMQGLGGGGGRLRGG